MEEGKIEACSFDSHKFAMRIPPRKLSIQKLAALGILPEDLLCSSGPVSLGGVGGDSLFNALNKHFQSQQEDYKPYPYAAHKLAMVIDS